MLSQYYDWQLIRELPMAELGGLLSYCVEKEAQKVKFPLWLFKIAVSKLTGEEPIGYEEMFNTENKPQTKPQTKKQTKKQSGEEILAEFKDIIEADALKRGLQL